MRLAILDAVPTDLVTFVKVNSSDTAPTHIVCDTATGVNVRCDVVGSVKLYCYWDGAWNLHPQGSAITTWVRLVIGGCLWVCLVKDTAVDSTSQGFAGPCEY